MKHVVALVLLSLSAPLLGGERCTATRADRLETPRVSSIKPAPARTEIRRAPKLRAPALQRLLTGDIQIL